MSGGSRPIDAAAYVGLAVAAAAAMSAYWYWAASSPSNQSNSKAEGGGRLTEEEARLILDRFEEMRRRLDGVGRETAERARQQPSVGGGTTREYKRRGSSRSRKRLSRDGQPHPKLGEWAAAAAGYRPVRKAGSKHGRDAASDANVVPSARSDESLSDASAPKAPPKTIVTKTRHGDGGERGEGRVSRTGAGGGSASAGGDHRRPARSVGHRSGAGSRSSSADLTPEPVPVVLISDPGQDLDDEMMFVMARHLVSLDLISLRGVIANLYPSFARARLTRGTLDLLGLHRVPVGIGTDGGDVLGKHSSDQFEQTSRSYIVHEDGEAARGLESGHRLIQRLYDAADDVEYGDVTDDEVEEEEEEDDEDEDEDEDVEEGDERSHDFEAEDNLLAANKKRKKNGPLKTKKKIVRGGLTIVVTSSMKDIAIFVRDNPTLFASKTREVIIMGGCKPVPIEDTKTALAMMSAAKAAGKGTADHGGGGTYSPDHIWSNLATVECEPDSAHNNTFDPSASAFFYSQCQKMNITLTVVSRFAAYAAKMPRSVYDDLALTGSSIGWRLRNSQRASIDQLWQRACSPDPEVRKGLPPRCDRKWFITTFCGGDDDPSRCCADTAWDLVTGFMQYDTIALLAAIPAVREKYFDPFVMPPLVRAPNREEGKGEEVGKQLVLEATRGSGGSPAGEREGSPVGAAKPRRRSTIADESDAVVKVVADGTGDAPVTCPLPTYHRRTSLPNPRAIERAIARAAVDNEFVETPFEQFPGSIVPVAFDRGTRNLIGITEKEHNLKDPALLVNLLKTGYRQGILCNHHTQPHIILHLQLRWDNMADTLLTCLMLRSLWDMRLASVLGVIVSICPSDSKWVKRPPCEDTSDATNASAGGGRVEEQSVAEDEQSAKDEGDKKGTKPSLWTLAESIRETLCSIGLAHVKFLIVSGGDSMKEHKSQSTEAFRELYESAPPIGVTLVLTATFTSVWPFAERHPDLFRNKTVRVVHTGGALIWPARWGWAALPFSHGSGDENAESDNEGTKEEDDLQITSEQILVPDPSAQNHRLDMRSARLFYKRAQALSVPMVILSRHVAKECCIPRHFFDVLGSHGGMVGKRIYTNERHSLLNLWRCSCAPAGSPERGNLPERCDAQWFAQNFCAGHLATGEDEVWRSVEAVNLYSPIALLAALPGETLRSYFQTMPFPVRSATHHVVGLTEEVPPRNVTNPSELRSLVVQSLLSAALANESEFGQDPPPVVPIRMDHEQRRRAPPFRSSSSGVDVEDMFGAAGPRSSVMSAISFSGLNVAPDRGPYMDVDEDDLWNFSEAARREIFSRTVAQTSKNAMLPKETKRKFVGAMTAEGRIAAMNGFIPPKDKGE